MSPGADPDDTPPHGTPAVPPPATRWWQGRVACRYCDYGHPDGVAANAIWVVEVEADEVEPSGPLGCPKCGTMGIYPAGPSREETGPCP